MTKQTRVLTSINAHLNILFYIPSHYIVSLLSNSIIAQLYYNSAFTQGLINAKREPVYASKSLPILTLLTCFSVLL